MAALPEHDDIADILIAMGVLIRPADVHGFLTGLLSVSSHMKAEEIQTRLVEFLDGEQPDPEQRAKHPRSIAGRGYAAGTVAAG